MRTAFVALLLGTTALASAGHAQSVKTAPQLQARGSVAGTDIFLDYPQGATATQAAYAADIATYVGQKVTNAPLGVDPTGVADSTSALQTWLNAGAPGTIPCGVYKTTATLTMQSLANSGQQVSGSGAGSSAGGGGCRTVIQPTSAVTTAFLIDGTPTGVWTMGMHLSDLVVDMVNMTDASTTSAFNQIKSYDVSYDHVRVINYGGSKRSWLLNAGSYTTTLSDIQGGIVDLEGASSSNQVTTTTIINPDIAAVVANQVANLRVLGGAVTVPAGGVGFTFTNVSSVYLSTDIEGVATSTAYAWSGVNNGIWLNNAVALSYAGGTYSTGTAPVIGYFNFDMDNAVANYPASLTTRAVALNCQAVSPCMSAFLSGSNSVRNDLYLGRQYGESIWGVAAAANDFLSGTSPGDTVLTSNAAGEATWIGVAGNPVAKFTGAALALIPGVALNVTAPLNTILSGSSSSDAEFYMGLLGGSSIVGVVSGANHVANGTVSGDFVAGSNAGGQHTFWICGGNPCWKGDSYGHQYTQGYPAPTAGTGTSGTPTGNDNAFNMQSGSGVTSSAVTFGQTWAVTPKCTVSGWTASAFPYISAVSTTSLTIGWSASVTSAYATVHCEG